MNKNTITVSALSSKEEAARAAGARLSMVVDRYRGTPVLSLLSGGSSLRILEHATSPLHASFLTIGLVDERCGVSQDNKNGARIFASRFVQEARGAGCDLLEMDREKTTVEETGKYFNEHINLWLKNHPDGHVIITQGIGPDGHTAGVFPHEDAARFAKLFENPKVNAVGYHVPSPTAYPERVTMTLSFLRQHVSQSIVYACGQDKKQALFRVFRVEGSLHETPARIILEMRQVMVYTDVSELEEIKGA